MAGEKGSSGSILPSSAPESEALVAVRPPRRPTRCLGMRVGTARVGGLGLFPRRPDACGDLWGLRADGCACHSVPAPIVLEASSVRFAPTHDVLDEINESLAQLRASNDAVLQPRSPAWVVDSMLRHAMRAGPTTFHHECATMRGRRRG